MRHAAPPQRGAVGAVRDLCRTRQLQLRRSLGLRHSEIQAEKQDTENKMPSNTSKYDFKCFSLVPDVPRTPQKYIFETANRGETRFKKNSFGGVYLLADGGKKALKEKRW